MTYTRTAALLAALLIGALLVAGCGGGGGEPSVSQSVHDLLQHEHDTALEELRAERTARQSAQASLQTARAEAARLTALIGAVTDAASTAATASLYAQLNAAKGEVTRLTGELTTATAKVTELETLVGDATNPTATSLNGQIAKLKTDLAAAQAQVTVLTGRLGTAETELEEAQEGLTTAQQQAQQAQREADQRIEDAERQAALGQRVSGLLTALGTDDLSSGHEEAGVTVEHMRGATGGRKFEPVAFYTRGSAAPSIFGWQSASFTRETSDNVDTLYLYTNIQPPSTRPFWKVHGLSVLMSNTDNDGSLALHARGSSVQRPADTNLVTDGHQFDGLKISGSLRGTGGTFTCPADTCRGTFGSETEGVDVHVTFAQGRPIFVIAGNWTFTPGSPTTGYLRPQDETYLYFGIWARHPKTATGTPDFKWIAGGGAQGIGRTPATLTTANFDALTGTATFTGGAVGQYAIDKTSVGGQVSSGTFTAKATLRAKFGTGPQLSGQITDFREGSASLTGWNVYLQGATSDTPPTLAATGVAAGAGVVASGTIDGVSATGRWEARLYGVDNMTAPADTQCPNGCEADVAGVTGWFNAASTPAGIVAIAGAFGASK